MQQTSTCLWFDDQAEAAVRFYTGIFPNSRVLDTSYYVEGTPRPAGSVLTIRFTLDGTEYLALNGGPVFKFSPAVSLVAYCDTQAQVDERWRQLSDGGQESQCGWVTDRFGLSWQVVPRALMKLMSSSDKTSVQRVFAAMMPMRKLDIVALQKAFNGG